MPGNRPNHRPAAGVLLIALLLTGLLIPTVSASETQSLTDSGDKSSYYPCAGASGGFSPISASYLGFKDITQYPGLWTVYTKTVPISDSYGMLQTSPNYYEPVTLKIGTTVVGTGYAGYNTFFDNTPEHTPTGIQIWLDIDTWDIKTYTGKQSVAITPDEGTLFNGVKTPLIDTDVTDDIPVAFQLRSNRCHSGTYIVQAAYYWENWITDTGARCILNRTIGGVYYQSDFELQYGTTSITDDKTESLSVPYISPGNWTVINPYGRVYSGALGGSVPDTPTSPTATVYVQNSQTGALLANAHLSILAAVGDPPELYEVVNATLPGGTGTYTLQPTGPTNPNPRYYKAVATVPGYTQIVENHSFTLNGPHDVIIEMRPDSGGPLDPDRAYLEFYVRDIHANPISSASVQCDGRIKTTNSQGYAVFEVSKNATYPYVAKKSGYVTIEGTATVADGPRYVANIVLGPGSVPTYTPTPDPSTGETPGATPTPDRRTNEEKGQSIIDMIADNAEPLAALALLGTFLGIFKLMAKW